MKTFLPIRSFILCTCFLIFSACHKGGSSFIEGHVLETGSELPLSGLNVKLIQTKNGGRDAYLAGDITDSEGHFKIYYARMPGYQYYFAVDSPDHVMFSGGKGVTKRKINMTLYAMPRGYVKFLLKNNLDRDAVFTILGTYSGFYNVKVEAGSELLTSLFSVKAYDQNSYQWRYITSKDTSSYFEGSISLNSKTDTLYQTIEIK